MASCGTTSWMPHQHKKKNRFCTAASAFIKVGSGIMYTQQMSGQQPQHAQQRQQRQQQRHAEQRKLQQRRVREDGRRRRQEEHERQSQGQQDLFLISQNESGNSASASDCDNSFAWKKAAARRSSICYACSFLFFLFLYGRLVVTWAEASSAVALPVEGKHFSSPPVLASRLEEATEIQDGASVGFAPPFSQEREQSSARSLSSSDSARIRQTTNAPSFGGSGEAYEFSWHGSRILALGDLHGDLLNCMLLLCTVGLIDPVTYTWRGGDALLIQTGDINDRGPQGVAVLDLFARLSVEARAAGGAVLQLLGNHDVMNICGDFRYAHAAETAQLGGVSGRRAAFDPTRGRYGRMMLSFLVAAKVDGVVFSHAGVLHEFASWGLPALTHRLRGELANDCELSKKAAAGDAATARGGAAAAVSGVDGPLWTRSFSVGPITKVCEEVKRTLHVLNAQKMVIGHTVQDSGRIETYCGGRLIAIDTGISRYVSNQPKMLEIKNGQFFEWSVQRPRPGEPTASALTTAAHKAFIRPLRIPPLEHASVYPTPKTEQPRRGPQFQEDVTFRDDELFSDIQIEEMKFA